MKLKPGVWPNHALVVLECDSLDVYRDREHVEYREPDFDNAVTGIATVDGRGLGHLKLLRADSSVGRAVGL